MNTLKHFTGALIAATAMLLTGCTDDAPEFPILQDAVRADFSEGPTLPPEYYNLSFVEKTNGYERDGLYIAKMQFELHFPVSVNGTSKQLAKLRDKQTGRKVMVCGDPKGCISNFSKAEIMKLVGSFGKRHAIPKPWAEGDIFLVEGDYAFRKTEQGWVFVQAIQEGRRAKLIEAGSKS